MSSARILVLGSGMACRTLSTAQALAGAYPRAKATALDVSSVTELESQISAYNLVISLVPYIYHASIIKVAIKYKVNVVTTSYVSDAIRDLDALAKEAGTVVLNEVGVDPGVDHLYAVKKINEVHSKGGKVREFHSYCGGLPARRYKSSRNVAASNLKLLCPAAEHAQNPLGFKFSWSPRGALLSQCNSARFLHKGKEVVNSDKDLMGVAEPYFVLDGYDFVAYPNRNSIPFRDFYDIAEAGTFVRGSLRYRGNPALVKALMDLGWLDAQPKEWLRPGMTWVEIMQRAINCEDASESALILRVKEICKFPSEAESERILGGLRWIDVFSSNEAPIRGANLLDTLCAQLEKELSYRPGERDLVMLQHKFVVEWENGQTETSTSTLELYGDPHGYSAMAKSVGVTCGIGTQLLLDGHEAFNVPGVLAPYKEEMCAPIRELLKKEGIEMVEQIL